MSLRIPSSLDPRTLINAVEKYGAQQLDRALGLPSGTLENAIATRRPLTQTFTDSFTAGTRPNFTPMAAPSGGISLGGSLYSTHGSVGDPNGPFFAQGSLDLGRAQLDANGHVHFSGGHIGADGSFTAALDALDARGSIRGNDGFGNFAGQGSLEVGARAQGAGKLDVDLLHGNADLGFKGDAFAGARAGAELQQTVGPIGIDAGFKAEAGVGAHFDGDIGFHDGKLSAEADIGAALGIGADFKLGLSLDVGQIAHDAESSLESTALGMSEVLSGLSRGDFSQVARGIASLGHGVWDGAKAFIAPAWDIAKSVGSTAFNVARAIGSMFVGGAKAVGGALADGAKAVGGAIVSGAKAVGNAIGDGVKAVGNFFSSIF